MQRERRTTTTTTTTTTFTGRGSRLVRWVGLLVLCLLAWGPSRSGQARVQPYYVLRGASFGQIQPRILFVLDTSGSMGFRSGPTALLAPFLGCQWDECEIAEGQIEESRISAARRAMRQVIDASEAASFSLMTFEQPRPPTAVPPTCPGGVRFEWVFEFTSFSRLIAPNNDIPIENHSGGMWRLCQGEIKRPYPYLRWDELGVGAVTVGQHETGAVPPSPLLDPASGDFEDPANALRRVQWFPQFMGVRVHLQDDPADNEVLDDTWGDYADDAASRASQVRGHDFYYWPYVDGFPGYGSMSTLPYDTAEPIRGQAGVSSQRPEDVDSAQLYAPFYLDLVDVPVVPADARGPASREDSRALVRGVTAPLIEGGVDLTGLTPWASVIGDIPATPIFDNRAFSHSTVASYLSFVTSTEISDYCAPTSVVLLTDGEPSPGEGGGTLYGRLSALRNDLGVPTYVVGFFVDANEINQMACAANGACNGAFCVAPCTTPSPHGWDTCADPDDPANCAYLANSASELQFVINEIIDQAIDLDLPSGPGSAINDFGVGSGGEPGGQTLQTKFDSFTEWPGWRGHVTRALCEDRYPDDHPDFPGQPMPHCDPALNVFDEVRPTFGPCEQSREWDAGVCLQSTTWNERRIYTNAYDPDPGGGVPNHRVVRISNDDGSASGDFVTILQNRGLLSGPEPAQAQADAIASFVLGEAAPDGWKLPGLSGSAPIVVRRVPPYRPDRVPEVSIRDPHCAGRLLSDIESGALPDSLLQFAQDAWDEDNLLGAGADEHYEYQEAVLVGDDMGVLHAFQLDSGNELFGFIPQFALENLAAQAALGPEGMGQPEDLDDHIYGLAATLNHGWVLDDTGADDPSWRHLGVIGMGPGGTHYVAVDLSHMSPESPREPLEVLWTTEDPGLALDYSTYNGETWARPALGYYVDSDQITSEPDAFFIFGGGYQPEGSTTDQGRTLIRADALTGEIIEAAQLPDIVHPVYESDFGALVDPAVGSHCISRYWAEMQEVYVADPAGRLFRWDQGRDTAHVADSGGPWGGVATPVFTFRACEGTATCSVDGGNAGDVFIYPAAISANDRIDDFSSAAAGEPPEGIDQFLVALVSGSPYEDTLDHGLEGNEFHSSIYLLVDDHSTGDPGAGFTIPAGGGKVQPGDAAGYMRIALSDIERERRVTPYAGGPELVEVRNFSRAARPIRAPRIFVTGVGEDTDGDGAVDLAIDGVEIYYVSFTVYEPGSGECNEDFYDSATGTWHLDEGSTYEITFRLTADVISGFDFIGGSTSDAVEFPGGFSRGLELVGVEQLVGTSGCADGNCGPSPGAPAPTPCDNNSGTAPSRTTFALTVSHNELPGFTPVE